MSKRTVKAYGLLTRNRRGLQTHDGRLPVFWYPCVAELEAAKWGCQGQRVVPVTVTYDDGKPSAARKRRKGKR